jgi:hypothetical protein
LTPAPSLLGMEAIPIRVRIHALVHEVELVDHRADRFEG